MKHKFLIGPLFALGLASVPALAAEPAVDPQAEARINFVNHGGIRDWRAGGRDVLYVQDRHRRWYKATLMGRPIGLLWAQTIGFQTRGIDTFDRFSSVIVDGFPYAVKSVVRIEGNPPTRKQIRAAMRADRA